MNSSQPGFKCEKCGATRHCTQYTFHYGNSKAHSHDSLSKTYRVTVGGSRAAWICDVCFWRSIVFHPMPWLLLITPFFVYFALSINYLHVPLGNVLLFTLAMYFFYFITSAHSKYHLLEFWFGAGSRQAMKVYKRILKSQGYHLFWTPGVYEKIISRK